RTARSNRRRPKRSENFSPRATSKRRHWLPSTRGDLRLLCSTIARFRSTLSGSSIFTSARLKGAERTHVLTRATVHPSLSTAQPGVSPARRHVDAHFPPLDLLVVDPWRAAR